MNRRVARGGQANAINLSPILVATVFAGILALIPLVSYAHDL
jgi:hypothetical protein